MNKIYKKVSFLTLVFAMLLLPSLAKGESMNTATLELYYSPHCPYCIRVMNYISKEHLAITLVDVTKTPGARQDLIQKGGKSQVPCLFIDGHPLYESLDIIKWLQQNKDSIEHTQNQ